MDTFELLDDIENELESRLPVNGDRFGKEFAVSMTCYKECGIILRYKKGYDTGRSAIVPIDDPS